MRAFGLVALLGVTACEEPAYVPAQLTPAEHDRAGDRHLLAGEFAKSVAHFDAYLRAEPTTMPQHWRRGIALYYAGRYRAGVEQFEKHRTVNPDDVENAVWHFLCNARLVGLAKARAALLPVGPDSRVTMPVIYEMFAGRKQPADVLALAGRSRSAAFYAHLYVGLYHFAHGADDAARQHIKLAVEHRIPHYMGELAVMHHRHFGTDQTR